MHFTNQKAKLKVYKDGESLYGELFVGNTSINKSQDFELDISTFEGQEIDCILNNKTLMKTDGELVKIYNSVFSPQTILDMYIENGIAQIKVEDIVIEEFECDLNLPHYKVNVTDDEHYTIVRYANLHQHTENSLLDGIVKIPELANKTEYACAITDHGNMFGWHDFKKALEKKNKKPIIGEEFYIETFGGMMPLVEDESVEDDFIEKMFDNVKVQNEKGLNGEHLIVLAKNNKGIKNLFKLSSEASLHFHRKPHITFELLQKYKEGLIVCSACIAGGLSKFIKEYLKASKKAEVKKWIEDYGEFFYLEPEYQETEYSHNEYVYEYCHKKTREYIEWFHEEFKDDFYLEYQDHHFPLEKVIMEEMVRIRNEEYPDIKIVATCDAHYLNKDDSYVHELWLCNQTKKTIDDPKHMKFSGDGYYVHTSQEMLDLFPVEYLDATLEIADKVNYEPTKDGYHLPHFPLPKGFTSEEEYLRYKCRQGFTEKFKGRPEYNNPIYLERMKTEIDTVVSMGWPAYFLIVSDFIKWAEDENVREHWQDYFPDRSLEEIPSELLDKKKIYTGSGRGCVCAGTKIYTENSLKDIEDITVGEKVRTHTGKLKKVLATHKYPINEPLYKIRCSYDDEFGNAYTKDHKILVTKKEDEKPQWISAKDIQIGDYVIQPKFVDESLDCRIKFESKSFEEIAENKIKLCKLNIPNGLKYEKEKWIITTPLTSFEKIIETREYICKQVTNIEKINNEKFVYDITVEDDHSYVTSSFVAHNSGAGSLMNYCLGITKVEPIIYDLKFERFLNPDRISMPDIDTDFEDENRGKVLDYVRFKYGKKKVANIITFGTVAAKNSIKVINRVLGGSVIKGNSIANLIPAEPGMTIEKAMNENDFRMKYESDPEAKKIIDLAMRVEGLKSSQSIHPCASLICDENITEYMPELLMTNPDTGEKIWVTQMEGPTCEELGCLKMDFLGLRTLGYVKEAIRLIEENTGEVIDYDNIPLDDLKVYQHLAQGNTASIFQCESDMFTTVIKKTLQDIKDCKNPAKGKECFDRLVAMNALVRPGSNLFIDDFADRILHPEHITYLVPELEPILKDTYGIILYQEQTMRITRDLAGFSAGQADTVRKAMGHVAPLISND